MLIFKNIEKFIIFFKSNTFLYYTNKLNTFKFHNFSLFLRHFFSKLYIKWVYNLNVSLVNNYTSNLLKSALYGIFDRLTKFFSYKKLSTLSLLVENELVFNQYFFSTKTLNTRLSKTFFKNIFFFNMLLISNVWQQFSHFINFYLNFIIMINNLKTFRFYGGYFLKVYSH